MHDLRMDPDELRTVPPPDLRIPGARPLSDFGLRIDARPVEVLLDAQARDLRTAGDKIAQLTADVDRLNREHELLVAQLRLVSEQMAALVVAVARA